MFENNPPVLPVTAYESVYWHESHGATTSMALAEAARNAPGPLLLICANSEQVERSQREIQYFLGNSDANGASLPVLGLPDWETLPYDSFSPHQDIISDRLQTLFNLPALEQGIVVLSITSLMHLLPPSKYIAANSLDLKKGQSIQIEDMRKQMVLAGYQVVEAVMEHGEISQVDEPSVLYSCPDNRFVADFIGQCNLLDGKVIEQDGERVRIALAGLGEMTVPTNEEIDFLPGDACALTLRPEKIRLARELQCGDDEFHMRGEVHDMLYLGDVTVYIIEADGVRIEALLANALLFPVRLILPYMLVNTHSIVSATEYRKTGLSARLKTCLKLTGRRHKSVESVVPQKQVRITWTL